jgi:hypothetical protein
MFDLEKLGVGEWFPYQDSVVHKNPDGTIREVEWLDIDLTVDEKVCFKQPDAETMRLMRDKYKGKKVNTPVYNTITRAMEIVKDYEQTSEQEKDQSMEFWDNAIVEWTIKNPKTKEVIPCTKENKYKLITMVPAFVRFCNRCLEILSGSAVEKEKADEKNS